MNGATPPLLSVVIASHERREMLRRCLDSLCRQTADPGCFETIVVDDGSTDGTAEMVEALEPPFGLRLLRKPNGGQAAALNAGFELAAGDVCLILDDDVIASPELVEEHLAAHRRDPTTLAIGALTQRPPGARDWYANAFASAWNERYDELAQRTARWSDCYGGNLSAPKEQLLEVGGFATDLAAAYDLDLGFRLERAGCTPTFLPRAHAIHDDRKLRRRMLDDARRYGGACVELADREPAMRRRTLNWFTEPTVRDVTLRRLMLALRVPPRALAAAGRSIPGRSRRQVWFGFVSRYTFWLGVREAMSRAQWKQTTRGVPVLMYHAFTDASEGSRFVISRRAFALQMRALRLLRYRPIGFEELARALREGRALPPRSVAITIDDGYRDNLEVAMPVLRRHRLPATVFLVSGLLGRTNEWHGEETDERALLSLEEVRQMRAEGIEVGAHTRTHPALPELADNSLDDEVAGSREDLEAGTGAAVGTFAYPYGRLDRRAVAAAERAGFVGACTTRPTLAHPGDDPLLVPRIEIRGTDPLPRFLRKLWFGGS